VADVIPTLFHLDETSRLPVTPAVLSFLARAGRVDEARRHWAEHPYTFEHDDWLSPFLWGCAAEAGLTVGLPDLAAQAYERLAPYAGRPCQAGSSMASGPVDGFLALAAAATGEQALATRHVQRALELCKEWDIPLVARFLDEQRRQHGF
jgi:hypothetical protein